jgi:NRAMP (natural resistance-associated macrophage protein)-like metal ion transporter
MPNKHRSQSLTPEAERHSHTPVVRYFGMLGPGLVTGASDDDPSGITTYSVAGASFGYGMLWTAAITLPLMAAIQLVCARIGLVSGRGLAGALRQQYPRGFLYGACVLLLVANVFNIAADLGGMGDAAEMLMGVPSLVWVPCFGLVILVFMIYTGYSTFARYLKWLSAVLFCYIASAILAKPDWKAALLATFVPQLQWTSASITTFVGILGTTISPYLFFWQAAQEVEEERKQGRSTVAARRGATEHELRDARLDVGTGMFFSNLVMYAIILATATTLFRAGLHDVASSRQAAEALRPLAGDAAYLLFAVGLIGAGLLAIPVLAGSASYAVAELFAWRAGLDLRPHQARRFYLVLGGSIVAGIILDVFNTNPIRMLFWSAVLNGLLAPPLMVLVMLVGNNRKIMGPHTNGPWLNGLGWTATVLMAAAAIAFFATLG